MAVGVDIVSNFDGGGITKAIKAFKGLDGAANKSAFALGTIDKSVTSAVKGIAKAAAAISVAAGVIGFKLVSAAYESQKVMAQTEALIKSTGGAAGVTAEQVSALSEKLSMQIGVDDELIQSSANLLLTFKQVANQAGAGNNIFDRTVVLSQDLGNVFGSAEGAAMQLGKALSDPANGLTALKKAGINFTDQQKEQIKTLVESGNSLEAQKVILAEVESQVGGTAAATATGFDRMKVAMGNVAENAGALLIPFVERFANLIIDKVVPYLNKLVDIMGTEGLGGVLQQVGGDFLDFLGNMGTAGNVVMGLVTAFVALKVAMLAYTIANGIATIGVKAFGFAWNATGIGLIAAAIALIVIGLIALYLKFESVRKVVAILGEILKFVVMNAIAGVYNYFVTFINAAIIGINLLIKGANLFGAGLKELNPLGYMAFQGLNIGADKAKTKVLDVADALRQVKNEERRLEGKGKVDEKTPPFGGGAGAAVKTLKEMMKDYKDAVLGVAAAQVKLKESGKGIIEAQEKVKDAGFAVADAFRNIGKAQDDVSKAQRDYTKAQDNTKKAMADVVKAITETEEAQTKLGKATTLVTKAQQAFDLAVNGYGASSKQGLSAQEKLQDSQMDLEESGYSLEESQWKVIDAENELLAVRTNSESTARDIRQAEIDLATAKLDLVEANNKQTQAQTDVTLATDQYGQIVNGVKETSDIYKELLDQLNEAKVVEKDATDAVTAAKEAEAEATTAVSDALLEEAEALTGIEDAKYALAKAVRDHEKALYDEAAAIEAVAKAQLEEAQSLLAVAEAQQKVNEAKRVAGLTPAAIGKVDKALAGVLATTKAVVAGVSRASTTSASGSTTGMSASALEAMMYRNGLAHGGIAMKPTLRLLGEAGPEAVIPLPKLNGNGNAPTYNITVNAGLGANGAEIGKDIIDAIKKQERRSGKVFAAA